MPLRRPRVTPTVGSDPKFWEKILTIAIGGVLTCTLCIVSVIFPTALERTTNAVSDLQIGLLPQARPSSVPVIVVVDEKSLEAFGQWPWPRYRLARLLDVIAQSGAAAVGVDAIFAERDRTSPAEIRRVLKQGFHRDLSLKKIPELLWDYDKILAHTLASGPFVLSYFFEFEENERGDCRPKSANSALFSARSTADSWQDLHRAAGVLCSVPILNDVAGSAGFNNTRPDDDGIYRRTPLIMEWHGRIYPSLAVQTLLTAAKLDQMLVESRSGGFTLRMGSLSVPLDSAGNLLIRFRGPGRTYETISAIDLLSGRVAADHLQGKIVFLGASATGLKEYRSIHYDPLFTGVEFHTAIVDNLLRQDYLERPAVAPAIELASALIVGLALSVLLAWSGPLTSALIPFLLVIGIVGASQILLLRTGLVISPVLSVFTIVSILLVLSLFKYGREQLRAKAMLCQILAGQEATIEGFCAMSEYRDPETGAHLKRTQNYVKALAEHLRDHLRFQPFLDDISIELMYKTAPLHDIGKIGVPDHILLKSGRLTNDEFELMKKHVEYGAQLIELIKARMGKNDFLRIAEEIVLGHQEKWDGTGYPQKLAGEAISVSARLMALADVYDALISRRAYKPPFSHRKAVRIISERKGTHFDPDVVEAFLEIEGEFRKIALRFLDSEDQRDTLLGDDAEGDG